MAGSRWMVRQKMYRRIQQEKEQGASISAIARELGMDRKTAAKYYHMRPDGYREYRAGAAERSKRVARHHEEILELYEANGFVRLNMAAVYDHLVERHGKLPYTEKTLRNYIRYLRENGTLVLSDRVRMFTKVPELRFGKQLQVDFGEYECESGLKLWIFSAVLSASRYKYMAFGSRAFRTLDVIGHLLDCFAHLGGLVEELVIDQDALLVVSENSGEIIYTKQFAGFIDEMGLAMYVCRKADPQSKGKVENTIKYVKHNFLAIRDFEDLADARQALKDWLDRRANGAISQATRRIPREMLEEEREHLRPLRNSIFRKDSLGGRQPRTVNEHSYISAGGSLYSVPTVYRGRTVEIYQTPARLFIFDQDSGIQLAEHAVAAIPGTTVTDRATSAAQSTLQPS
jgi:transposase